LLLLGASLAQLFLGDGFLRESERIKDPKARLLFEQANQYRLSGFRKSTAVLAEQNLRGALEIEPDNPLLQGELAYLLSVMHRLYEPLVGRVEEASFLAAEALRSDPRSLEAWWAKSILLRSRDDKDGAIQAATRAMEINQEKVRSYICLGNALIDNGEVDEGLEYLRKGIDKEGGAVYARQTYATALTDLGRLDEAIVENKKVLELAPGHPEALNNLGGCYLYSGRYLESVPYFRRLLDLYPDADAASNLGVAYHYLGRMDAAVEAYLQANDLRPGDPTIEFNLGDAFGSMGDEKTSKEWYSRAVASADTRLNQGGFTKQALQVKLLALVRVGLPQEAIEGARRLAKDYPTDPQVLYTAAVVHAGAEQKQDLLKFTKLAIAHGISRERFLDPDEFGDYLQDPDFLALLESDSEAR
jgi:tetratricopeptide (TPR) repeat protein